MSERIVYAWSYKGMTEEKNTATFSGHIVSDSIDNALSAVEKMMRAAYPQIKWMHGKKVEGPWIKYGPTVTKTKLNPEKIK